MKIPAFDAQGEFEAAAPALLAAAERVLRSGRYILGPEVEAFEGELAAYLGIPHAVGVASGTDALILALRGLGIGPGDKVITPAFSFFASAGAVASVGAQPVLADIDPTTFCLDPIDLDRALRQSAPVAAVVVVHLYGQCADMDTITAVARAYGAHIVEDAAQAMGASFGDRQAGTMGDAGCLSFFPTKNLGAFGDAGAVITADDELAGRVRLLRAHGSRAKYVHEILGTNSRLDALQAGLLRTRLPYLEGDIESRRAHAASYTDALAGAAGIDLPRQQPRRRHTWHQYTVRLADRDRVRRELADVGVETAIHYPAPLHHQKALTHLDYDPGCFPHACDAARRVLSLPMFPTMRDDQIAYVAGALGAAAAGSVSH